jgi:hypothetical protein
MDETVGGQRPSLDRAIMRLVLLKATDAFGSVTMAIVAVPLALSFCAVLGALWLDGTATVIAWAIAGLLLLVGASLAVMRRIAIAALRRLAGDPVELSVIDQHRLRAIELALELPRTQIGLAWLAVKTLARGRRGVRALIADLTYMLDELR